MNFDDDFKDKTILLTGAAGGLGKQTAIRFAQAGANVIICDVKIDLGKQTAKHIEKSTPGSAQFIALDVVDEVAVCKAFEEVIHTFGTLDILVNCAGVTGNSFKPFHVIETKDWDLTYNVNVKGVINCCKAALKPFKKNKAGKIVNVSSVSGKMPTPGLIHYAASKAAVNNMSQSLAAEMAKYNVNVNVVCPGWIWTPIYDDNESMKDLAKKMGKTPRDVFLGMVEERCHLKREQTEDDIANVILFLCSDAAKNITGQSINIDGGYVMS